MAITPRIGDNSWFAIARQTDCDTPVDSIDDFVQNKFPFTSLGIDVESELQASEAIVGRRSDTRDQQGQLWGSGPIETQLYIDKMDEFWRAIINSDAPSKTGDPQTIVAIEDKVVHAKAAYSKTIDIPDDANPDVPSQLEITLSVDSGNLPDDLGKVDVYGQRRVGLETDDVIPMKETELTFENGVAKTTKYFAKVDEVVFSKDAADMSGVETTIAAKSGQSKFVYKNEDDIFPGWTMQLVRGNVPAVAEGAVPVNSTLTISDNIRLSMEILARKLHPFRQIGTTGDAPKITNDLRSKPFVPDVFYPNWGGYLKVEDACLIFTNLTLNINQNLDFLPGIKGSRYRLPVAATSERRNVNLNATVYYDFDDPDNSWSKIFENNASRALTASCYYWNEEGKEFRQTFKLPVSYLTASPRIGVDNRGPMTRELAFKGVPASDTDPDEIEIEIVMDTPA